MDNLLERASPRRGSLNSLHRYPSGSFSSNPKQSSLSNTLQVNSTNLYTLCKDLDKFTRYFIVKAVQVIVQSRTNGSQKIKTDCKPHGNDWFNLNISDIVEVSDKTKAVLDAEGLSVKSNWRVCCEISMKSSDGSRIVLEHWIISNRTHFNSSQKLNSGQASPKGFLANRVPTNHLTSSNGSTTSPLSVINSTGRIRNSTFSNLSRTRLNSIDDTVGDINLSNTKLLMGVTDENINIKPSTSCFSLTSTPTTNQQAELNNLIIESPSANSLNANSTTNSTNTAATTQLQQQDQQLTGANISSTSNSSTTATTKTSATSSIYTIYNRMSLLLKTLLTTAHIVPAYRAASRTSQTESCVICYRVYSVPRQSVASRGSIEDINSNFNHSESPGKRSLTSTSSLGSVDIREFVNQEELDHFCPALKLGSIKTEINELDVSVCYRTDTKSSGYPLKNHPSRDAYNRILDEDCLTAAKQLLAGNQCLRDSGCSRDCYKNGSNNSLNYHERRNLEQRGADLLEKPLQPAFASANREIISLADQANNRDSSGGSKGDPELLESAFESLLQNKLTSANSGDKRGTSSSSRTEDLVVIANDALSNSNNKQHSPRGANDCENGRSTSAQSEPIQVPRGKGCARGSPQIEPNHRSNLTPGSTPKSLTDSYVFVDLNPPFASDEQNDINSFFHGPSPSFTNGLSSSKDVDELTSQLATIEASASQIDEFVDNICTSEDDETIERDHSFR